MEEFQVQRNTFTTGESLPALGFGAMRLATKDGVIDEAVLQEMVDFAMAHGVNYFDTAVPYHGGKSELAIGRALAKYPRESFYLADKFPGHQIRESYDPAEVFEKQLKKCGVEYFDFYLLHNVYEKSLPVYEDPQWGIIDYFIEQRRLGRIRHLGFSTHARPDCLKEFLDRHGDEMEFCQIQLNYLDETLQEAGEKVRLLNGRHIPIWVMEPLRGGRLAKLSEAETARLAEARPGASAAEWAFCYLQSVPGVTVVLSGMGAMEQMEDNIRIFSEKKPLNDAEFALLRSLADGMKNSLPCTACRYCCDGCPMGLEIPALLRAYNEIRFSEAGFQTPMMELEALPEEKKPHNCIGCGACAAICPQNIDIPTALSELSETIARLPSWASICEERARLEKAEG